MLSIIYNHKSKIKMDQDSAQTMNEITIRSIFKNWSWSFVDKILRMGAGLLVTSWMARQYGPSLFGIWNYAIAFTSLASILSTLGLNEIIVRELLKHPKEEKDILGTALTLKILGGMIIVIICSTSAYILYDEEYTTRTLIIVNALCFLVQPFEVLDFYFHSKMKIKNVTIARNASFLLITLVRVYLIVTNSSLIILSYTIFLELIFASIFLIMFYQKESSILDWKFKSNLAATLIQQSWPLMLSGLMSMVYMKIDQLMIKDMLDNKSLGEFSAAVRLSEVWYFIPMTLTTAFFPSLMNLKKENAERYQEKIQQLFDILALVSISLGLITSILSPLIIEVIYGEQYSPSASILTIHIWAGVFVFLGVGSTQWLVIEGFEKYSFPRIIFGAILNIFLNLLLIPISGAWGSAISTLISQASAAYIANGITPKLRPVFQIQTLAIINTFRFKIFRQLINQRRNQ